MSKELIDALEKAVEELKKNAVCCVEEAYDPHAENKALYEQDALETDKPWERWQYKSLTYWNNLSENPAWITCIQYRRKQTKKRVDWSCPLLKGANTNCGELFQHSAGTPSWLCGSGVWVGYEDLQLNQLQPSNWQAYNGEDLNLLHEAGFVVQVKYWDTLLLLYSLGMEGCRRYRNIASYRVIAIRDGFTHNPEEVV